MADLSGEYVLLVRMFAAGAHLPRGARVTLSDADARRGLEQGTVKAAPGEPAAAPLAPEDAAVESSVAEPEKTALEPAAPTAPEGDSTKSDTDTKAEAEPKAAGTASSAPPPTQDSNKRKQGR